ncbi:cyclin-P1-1 [Panicum miliaceum]|uniref:Cyclin-P1-1 n=1 Tax=Panicum miliaceum TaxID=4540 RepID=A0A3L6PUT1_PANMI|nr:cyclin-P1-1 [Panicum miliaceum]
MTAVAALTDAAAAGDRSPSSSPPRAASAWPPPAPPELAMVARAVQRLVARNDAVAAPDGRGGGGAGGMRAFEAARGAPAPRIGVAEYLERMHRYAGLDPECYVVAYAYVDMAAHRRPAAAVASRNVHRLLLTCLLVASKVLDDFHHSNAFFARVGGVSNAEMNKLELELLGVLDFAVAVDHRAYGRYREHLEKEMRRDHHGPPGAAPKPTTRAAAAPTAVKLLLPPLAEERRAEIDDGDSEERGRKPPPNGVRAGEEHDRKLPNGVAPGAKTLRELCALDYY